MPGLGMRVELHDHHSYMSWKECGNCGFRDEVANAKVKCSNCGASPLYKTMSRNPNPGKEVIS